MEEISAGGIIVKDARVVIVAQGKHSFSLPKGHLKQGETILEGAYREIYEECGLKKDDLVFVKKCAPYKRTNMHNDKLKELHFFVFTTTKEELKPVDPANPKAMWIPIDEVVTHLGIPQDKEFFESNKEELKKIK